MAWPRWKSEMAACVSSLTSNHPVWSRIEHLLGRISIIDVADCGGAANNPESNGRGKNTPRSERVSDRGLIHCPVRFVCLLQGYMLGGNVLYTALVTVFLRPDSISSDDIVEQNQQQDHGKDSTGADCE